MRILIIHNEYGNFSGEEAAVRDLEQVLMSNGHNVIKYIRSSKEIEKTFKSNLYAFRSGIYSGQAIREIQELLLIEKPDIIHIHNLYPLISPAILGECYRIGIPIVMSVHNYRLICPNGLLFTKGKICEKCVMGKEYWCIVRNCERNILKSIGYSIRNWVARKNGSYNKYIGKFICLTNFQWDHLVSSGFPSKKMAVIPNMISQTTINNYGIDYNGDGEYVGFIGRISPEKGLLVLAEAARLCPGIPFKIAGGLNKYFNKNMAPQNVDCIGHITQAEILNFYRHARFIIFPSIWYEGFPITLLESMIAGKPIVCSNIGGLPEIVEDGKTGYLFEAGNPVDLSRKIKMLWDNNLINKRMGKTARDTALKKYSSQNIYIKIMNVYNEQVRGN